MKLLALLLVSCLTSVSGLAYPRLQETAAVGDIDITWSTNCTEIASVSSVPFSCAKFNVPLDYTEPNSTETLTLTLVKVDAVEQPVKGSILFNPGGPGGSGVQFMVGAAKEMMT